MGQPFARARQLAALIAATVAATQPGVERELALAGLPAYRSHGKGGKRAHRPSGAARVKRAAVKVRNVARHRAARNRSRA